MNPLSGWRWLGLACALSTAAGYLVPIRDTDDVREVCSGMYGGKQAFISLTFDDTSVGQVAVVIYEWKDAKYLGADTISGDHDDVGGDPPKTYICTTSAVRSGLCSSSQLGQFITSLPDSIPLSSTSIFTSAIKFQSSSFPTPTSPYPPTGEDEVYPVESSTTRIGSYPTGISDEPTGDPDEPFEETGDPYGDGGDADESYGNGETGGSYDDETDQDTDNMMDADVAGGMMDGVGVAEMMDDVGAGEGMMNEGEDDTAWKRMKRWRKKRQLEDPDEGDIYDDGGSDDTDEIGSGEMDDEGDENVPPETPSGSGGDGVETYTGPIEYTVPKTGYYCVGIVPVTLVGGRSIPIDKPQQRIRDNTKRSTDGTHHLVRDDMNPRQTHAEYSGTVLFRNTFEGELPAVEYPKINFYFVLSVVYFVLGCGWAYLCVKYRSELLPMQYYISGTILFLIIEMLAQFAYYRYVNKHGGNTGSLVFLFVIATLNAARNSLSFFLLLIVSMGLSVVTQSLGVVMNRVRILTLMHFVFGVLYSIGTVQVELDSAPLFLILILIFPLALTLTGFLMWIIISLNGTILHLQARKQRYKLAMFKRLWRILVISVIAVAVFFVISSMSLSNRLEEDYAPNNWRYRWILLDGSLASIYLLAFSGIAWIWRPSRDNIRFSMSQELAQDEADADAEDYEIGSLEHGHSHMPLATEPQDDEEGVPLRHGEHGETVFAMGEDSDEEGYKDDDGKGRGGKDD
ncbi:major facilitator protein [Tremella mesenterica]|uniref:Major facilitator protein n=1 Tax=Tremella mesenterica TaxID=5217 RepID=A0A4Q1BPH8_TREME|nr:major facilitator protein [Tremella mesenterica]